MIFLWIDGGRSIADTFILSNPTSFISKAKLLISRNSVLVVPAIKKALTFVYDNFAS